MNVVDLIVLAAVLIYAVAGFRNGALLGAFSLGGFVLGALLGAQLARPVGDAVTSGRTQIPIAIACLLLCALLGQFLGVWLATLLRRQIRWRPAHQVDAALGAALGAVGALFVAWMVAVPLASAPYPALARAIRGSVVVHAVDATMPDPMQRVYANARRFVDRSGFPQVFGALGSAHIVNVPAPDPTLRGSAAARRAAPSVVKVYAAAPSCGRTSEGSGFVYAPGRVMTNAHVVAGGRSVQVVTSAGPLRASVVLFDPDRDVAVLSVPGLGAPALAFAGTNARTGQDAVVLGYPEDGPLDAEPARLRNREDVDGDDIYGQAGVDRQVYAIRGLVRQGNSGGPLLDSAGRVLGVVFASAVDSNDTGYVLTSAEVAGSARQGRSASARVSTQGCTA